MKIIAASAIAPTPVMSHHIELAALVSWLTLRSTSAGSDVLLSSPGVGDAEGQAPARAPEELARR